MMLAEFFIGKQAKLFGAGLLILAIIGTTTTGMVVYNRALDEAHNKGYEKATLIWQAQLAISEAKVQKELAEREKISAQLNSLLNETIVLEREKEAKTNEEVKKLSDGSVVALPLGWLRYSD